MRELKGITKGWPDKKSYIFECLSGAYDDAEKNYPYIKLFNTLSEVKVVFWILSQLADWTIYFLRTQY